MKIEVLGASCQKCEYIYRLIQKLIKENHVNAEVVFIQDMGKILTYNVMMTPAVVLDGHVVCVGRAPSSDEILGWLGCRSMKGTKTV